MGMKDSDRVMEYVLPHPYRQHSPPMTNQRHIRALCRCQRCQLSCLRWRQSHWRKGREGSSACRWWGTTCTLSQRRSVPQRPASAPTARLAPFSSCGVRHRPRVTEGSGRQAGQGSGRNLSGDFQSWKAGTRIVRSESVDDCAERKRGRDHLIHTKELGRAPHPLSSSSSSSSSSFPFLTSSSFTSCPRPPRAQKKETDGEGAGVWEQGTTGGGAVRKRGGQRSLLTAHCSLLSLITAKKSLLTAHCSLLGEWAVVSGELEGAGW
eukprot:736859-Rhodomonas_salina.1